MVGRLRARGWASDPNFDAHVANLHRAVVTVVVGGQATENAASG